MPKRIAPFHTTCRSRRWRRLEKCASASSRDAEASQDRKDHFHCRLHPQLREPMLPVVSVSLEARRASFVRAVLQECQRHFAEGRYRRSSRCSSALILSLPNGIDVRLMFPFGVYVM